MAWGSGIFDDDLAADVRSDWEQALAAGDGPAAATARLIDDYADEVAGDVALAASFWIALAAVQLGDGALEADVRDRAIRAIDVGADLPRWERDPLALIDPDDDTADELADRRLATASLRAELQRATVADAA